jgi:hypothetical protein
MESNYGIKVIKEIRKRENELWEKSRFCSEHNFNLDAEKFKFAESELRRVCRILEKAFNTGYINADD